MIKTLLYLVLSIGLSSAVVLDVHDREVGDAADHFKNAYLTNWEADRTQASSNIEAMGVWAAPKMETFDQESQGATKVKQPENSIYAGKYTYPIVEKKRIQIGDNVEVQFGHPNVDGLAAVIEINADPELGAEIIKATFYPPSNQHHNLPAKNKFLTWLGR